MGDGEGPYYVEVRKHMYNRHENGTEVEETQNSGTGKEGAIT